MASKLALEKWGIGIEAKDNYLQINQVKRHSPAEQVGIKSGGYS